nr:immunoglobulin heavy chain junction region [Mus musculus]
TYFCARGGYYSYYYAM